MVLGRFLQVPWSLVGSGWVMEGLNGSRQVSTVLSRSLPIFVGLGWFLAVTGNERVSPGHGGFRRLSVGLKKSWPVLVGICESWHPKISQQDHTGLGGSRRVSAGLCGSRRGSMIHSKSRQFL